MCRGGVKAEFCPCPYLYLMQNARSKRCTCCRLKMADGYGRCSSLLFSSVCIALGWKHSSRKNQIKLSAAEDFSLCTNPDVGT